VCVAGALGAALPPGEPAEGVGALLAGRRRSLLVLDHVDHLQEAATRAVAAWLKAAPQVSLLVVSRATLELEGEAQYVIAPLRLEATAGTDSDAVTLFLHRATSSNPRRSPSSWDRVAIRELVRRLEGMPLAIELAAAYAAEAPEQALRALLQDDPDAGMTGFHDAFETSWRQLTPEEQAALVRCAVFEGGFTAEAAMELLRPAGTRDTGAALQRLHRLRQRSLVRVTYATTSANPRFQMYQSIRERVAGRLPADEAAARRHHADYFLRLGERLGDGAERGSAVLDALATERENLVAAWRYWMGQDVEGARRALRVLLALDAFFVVRGPYGAQLSMLDATLARLEGPADRAPGLEARAKVLLSRGRLEAASADLEALLAAPGDEGTRARAIAYLGLLRSKQGNLGEAQLLFERAQAELRRAGDLRMEGRVFAHLGAVAMDRIQFDTSAQLYERALELHVRAGDRRFEAITLSNLATLHQMRGAWSEAEQSLSRSIALHRALGNRRSEGIAQTNLGDLERDRGASARALAQYQRALKVNQEVGNRRFEAICVLNHALLLLERREGVTAAALLDEALSLALALGDTKHVGLAQGIRGALRAWRGEPGAHEDISTALLTLEPAAFEPIRAAVELYAAELDLARAVSLEQGGREAEAQAAREAAAAKVALAVAPAAEGSRASRFEHVRMALRVLKALSDPSPAREPGRPP
jgi:predicted ATPase